MTIRALYEPALLFPWNPAEEQLLQLMESLLGPEVGNESPGAKQE